MKNLSSVALLVASLLCSGGCARNDTTPPSTGTQSAHVKTPAAGAGVSSPAAVSASSGLHGVVAERLDVPGYTYLRIKTSQGDVWAAIPTDSVAVGTEVTVINPVPMKQFQSKTLKRTFDVIMFAQGIQVGGSPAAAPGSSDSSHADPTTDAGVSDPHVANGNTQVNSNVDLDNIKVARATGQDARTVAEVYDQKKTLKDKTVSIRARVVKVTPGVMGRNWLHVRDGSGTDTARNNDLVVTTADEAKLNDEITVTGVVHTDRDFGSGYAYSVLVEDARITR